MAPHPKLQDTWAISLVLSLYRALPISKKPKAVDGSNGQVDLPEEDLTDGFTSEGNADSSDAGGASRSVKKRKSTNKKK